MLCKFFDIKGEVIFVDNNHIERLQTTPKNTGTRVCFQTSFVDVEGDISDVAFKLNHGFKKPPAPSLKDTRRKINEFFEGANSFKESDSE